MPKYTIDEIRNKIINTRDELERLRKIYNNGYDETKNAIETGKKVFVLNEYYNSLKNSFDEMVYNYIPQEELTNMFTVGGKKPPKKGGNVAISNNYLDKEELFKKLEEKINEKDKINSSDKDSTKDDAQKSLDAFMNTDINEVKYNLENPKIVKLYDDKLTGYINNLEEQNKQIDSNSNITDELQSKKEEQTKNIEMLKYIRDNVLVDMPKYTYFHHTDSSFDKQNKIDNAEFISQSIDKNINCLEKHINQKTGKFEAVEVSSFQEGFDKEVLNDYSTYINNMLPKKHVNQFQDKFIKYTKEIREKLYFKGANLKTEQGDKEYAAEAFTRYYTKIEEIVKKEPIDMNKLKSVFEPYKKARETYEDIYKNVKEDFEDLKIPTSNVDGSRLKWLPPEFRKNHITTSIMNTMWIAMSVVEQNKKVTIEQLFEDPKKLLLENVKQYTNIDYNKKFSNKNIKSFADSLWDWPNGLPDTAGNFSFKEGRFANVSMTGANPESALEGEVILNSITIPVAQSLTNINYALTGSNYSLYVSKMFESKENPVDFNDLMKNEIREISDDEIKFKDCYFDKKRTIEKAMDGNTYSFDELLNRAKQLNNATSYKRMEFFKNAETLKNNATPSQITEINDLYNQFKPDEKGNSKLEQISKKEKSAFAYAIIHQQDLACQKEGKVPFVNDSENVYKLCKFVDKNCGRSLTEMKETLQTFIEKDGKPKGFYNDDIPKCSKNTFDNLEKALKNQYIKHSIAERKKYSKLPASERAMLNLNKTEQRAYNREVKQVEANYKRFRKLEKKELKQADKFIKNFNSTLDKLAEAVKKDNLAKVKTYKSEKNIDALREKLFTLKTQEEERLQNALKENLIPKHYYNDYYKVVSYANVTQKISRNDYCFVKFDQKNIQGLNQKQKEDLLRFYKKSDIISNMQKNGTLEYFNVQNRQEEIRQEQERGVQEPQVQAREQQVVQANNVNIQQPQQEVNQQPVEQRKHITINLQGKPIETDKSRVNQQAPTRENNLPQV